MSAPDLATQRLLEHLTADPSVAGLFCDFDGTLTPIVDDPTSSRLDDDVGAVLIDVARRLAVVGIVSGRPAAFLGERAPLEGVRLLGLYGLEEWRDGHSHPRAEAAAWQDPVEHARAELAASVGRQDGVYVEGKGLAVAVHWRRAADPRAAELACTAAVAALAADTGLAVEPGKHVAELRPPVDWDKGAALRAVAEELALTAVVYIGDDRGDVPAFAAARERGGLAVAVDHGAETPAEVLDAADIVVDGPDGVAHLLRELRDALAGSS